MYARTKGWGWARSWSPSTHDNHSTPRRFEVTIELGGDLTNEQLRRLEKVAASCPVRRAIEVGIEFDETIAHRELVSTRPLLTAAGAS